MGLGEGAGGGSGGGGVAEAGRSVPEIQAAQSGQGAQGPNPWMNGCLEMLQP